MCVGGSGGGHALIDIYIDLHKPCHSYIRVGVSVAFMKNGKDHAITEV